MKQHHTHPNWPQRLRSAGLKATPVRLKILEVLSSGHKMLSIQEIFTALRRDKADLATVYRCIRKFEKAGLIDSVSLGDSVVRYEIHEESKGHAHHHHLICRVCNVAILIKDCLLTKVPSFVKTLGFSDVNHRLDFLGICPSCQTKS